MACPMEAVNEDYIEILIDYELPPETTLSSGVNFCAKKVGNGITIVYANVRDIRSLSRFFVPYSYIPKCYGLMQEETENGVTRLLQGGSTQPVNLQPLDSAGILRVQERPLSLTGQGVVIGFLDTGLRFDLPHFKNRDGSTRVLGIWDQTLSASQLNQNRSEAASIAGMEYRAPADLAFGVEFTQEDINLAIQSEAPYEVVPSYDENGHGTKLASVAAGSLLENTGFRGAAYECDIVMVKLRKANRNYREYYAIPEDAECYTEGDMILALEYLQRFSKTFERPLVICFGIGTSLGNHGGNSLFAKYLNAVALKRNQVVVVPGGNEGNTAGHYHGEINLQAGEGETELELLVGGNQQGFIMELWGRIPDTFTVALTSPAGEVLPRINYRLGQPFNYRFVYSETEISVEYTLVEQGSGQQLIVLRFENPLAGIWQLRVFAEGDSGKAVFDLWLPISRFLGNDTYFLRPDPDVTLTEPAYVREVLKVNAYQSTNNSFYLNSGRGFSAQGEITPDLTAPGVGIMTALGVESGSSYASAITAGAVADFMQWAVLQENELLANTESVKNYFIRGAVREQDLEYPNKSWGYGRLNLSGTFDKIAGVEY